MSFSNVTTDINVMHRIWLCNGCMGRYFIGGFFHGITDYNYMDTTKQTQLTASIGGNVITLATRNYTKHARYNEEWFDPHGIVFDGFIDTEYASYWGYISGDCWGRRKPKEWTGEYSASMSYTNTEIYFADLREDILVYYTETGSNSQSGNSKTPIGQALAYAIWNGAEKPACRGVNIQDAIKIPVAPTFVSTGNEKIMLGNYTVYNSRSTTTRPFNVAASEPYSSIWSMDVVDTTKPYDCKEGVFTSLIDPHEDLWGYRNSWDGTGSFGGMDEYDASIWNANFNLYGVDHIKDGSYDYPSFVNINSMPRGSWVTDHEGNHFYSMITKDYKTFNRLNGADPNGIAELTGAGVVYYPVAPA